MQSPHVQVWSFYHIFCFLSIWRAGWGVKRESNFKKYINDLHTSCFFFYLPTSTTQDHPLSLGQSTSVPILLVLPTNYWDCTMSWLAYYSIRQVHAYKVLIVNILLLEPHLKIGHYSTSASCTFLYSNVHFSLLADDCFHFLAIYRLLCIHDKGFAFPIDLSKNIHKQSVYFLLHTCLMRVICLFVYLLIYYKTDGSRWEIND